MSDDAYGATVAKRRLSRQLLQLRVKSGYTANHVCDMLNWGRGKVGRFEANQWKRPEMSDIRDLLRVYGVDPAERDEIEDLAIRSRARPWWRDCAEVFENEFPGFENDARRIRVFIPLVLPGLLQTQEYAEAFMKIGPRPLSAVSMLSGCVPKMGTPAPFNPAARLSGVWPPNCTTTPSGFSWS